MAAKTCGIGQATEQRQSRTRQCALTLAASAMAAAFAGSTGPAAAVGHLATLDVVTRADGQVLPVYPKDGRHWVVGVPGQEFSLRVCNRTGGRALAVMSVDGVNIVTGDTASPAQSGYVLGAWECADLAGWRKSMSRTAAFYFTELPDAYAARTGRPENVGVIGVAVFPERAPPAPVRELSGKLLGDARREAQSAQPGAAAAERAADAGAAADATSNRARSDSAPAAPAPMARLGTGHGRSEHSPTQMVRFERASDTPAETIAIHYDRRDNLVAMGILPPPVIARSPNPFPSWTPRFVPDPPR
jgi:hypothetical protein